MRPIDLTAGRILRASFTLSFGDLDTEDAGKVISVRVPDGGDSDEFEAVMGDGRLAVLRAIDVAGREVIAGVSAAGLSALCWVVAVVAPHSVALQAHFFEASQLVLDEYPLQIGILEEVLDDLGAAGHGQAIALLSDEFLLGELITVAFCLPGAENDREGFRLIGRRRVCHVQRSGSGALRCIRVTSARASSQTSSRGGITLLRGRISFTEDLTASLLRTSVLEALNGQLLRPESYLKNWEVYQELEKQAAYEEAFSYGIVGYHGFDERLIADRTEYVFHLDETLPAAYRQGRFEIDAAADRPHFEEATGQYLFPDDVTSVGEMEPGADPHRLTTLLEPDQARRASRRPPPSQGVLMRSIRGDLKQIERRKEALERVRRAETPLPLLPMLLEQGKVLDRRTRTDKALTARVQGVLRHMPTKSQRSALTVALNTPDIALIQGPPGTGKTTIIRALLTSIAENYPRARVLLASTQHDAVDNAVAGIDIGGLPAVRIGGRGRRAPAEQDTGLWSWIGERQAYCREKIAELPDDPARWIARTVDRKIDHWKHVRGVVETNEEEKLPLQELLLEIVHVAGDYLPPDLAAELLTTLGLHTPTLLDRPEDDDRVQNALKERLGILLSTQRGTAEAFAQDGPDQARRLSKFLGNFGADVGVSGVLQENFDAAAKSVEGNPADDKSLAYFFEVTARIRRAAEAPEFDTAEESGVPSTAQVHDLLRRVSRALHARAMEGAGSVADALAFFLEDLEDLGQVETMVAQYGGVVAATCQQCALVDGRKPVVGFSSSQAGGSSVATYDYVIVDEAARSNPLDLLIPMSRGTKIVLVGDHKQLPHILEASVRAQFAAEHGETISAFLEQSLFERLFEQLQGVEDAGGLRRTVTLGDDFRMHPVISRFVSDNFYDGTVEARCLPESRALTLGLYEDKHVAYLDIPRQRGAETSGSSKVRAMEADVIQAELERVLAADLTRTVGVITFYERQAALLNSRIAALPEAWRARTRVGTVDAFQGREFDVVFLSLVRSNSQPATSPGRVGFLALPNRLCVAFSRAKRLLVAVGDAETVSVVPQLAAFHALCRSTEGYYERR